MYIGKPPTVGNFQVCDAISVVNGQAAYTLQVGGVNVAPESANHMLVSLNGILQKPGSSFTISGSTMTFASNLATGDVIDFVQILGNVLDIGQPSDDTVTAAKINNDVISGQTALTSAPDDTDEFLVSDAGTIKRIDYSLIKGGLNTPVFSANISSNQDISNNTATTVAYANELFDTGSDYNNSTYKWTVGETGKYLIVVRAAFEGSAEFFCSLQIVKDGTGDIYSITMGHDENNDMMLGSILASLSAGDTYYVQATQTSGGTVALIGNNQHSEFSAFKLAE